VSLNTFDSLEEAARAYIAASWMFGWPKRKLNFLDVKSKQEFEFLAREEEKEHRLAMWQLTTHEFDEMAMASTDMRIQSLCKRGTSSMLRVLCYEGRGEEEGNR
jgi:hypothetical protein